MVYGKRTNGLMKHLRDVHGISIEGSKNKKDLLNMGYYHGYKGYRFIKKSNDRIPYTDFDEIVAIYQFDVQLKTLFYPHIMFIETALKNHTLDTLIGYGQADFDYIYRQLLNDYKKHDVGSSKYRKAVKRKLDLRNAVNNSIAYHYNNKRDVIEHFFHTNKPIPLWAIFEIINFGDFGFFVMCLNEEVRKTIAQDLNVHSTNYNQNGRIVEDMIFLIKELRNSVAHNSVIFDCRFQKTSPPARLKGYIENETNISGITFENIIDYLVVTIFLLKNLGVSKAEIRKVIKQFSMESEKLRNAIPVNAHTSIMGSDMKTKLGKLRVFV
ncbi:Abi family protein [Salicibibacter cibi]|uniref:Abi family protein n=1 Tax=Salicibibacter cibi TaxID=2743001 RepID=A0A7T7CGM4_9BACI|nr:Abi family protein [Salicibibacter cibi]QQK81335.1 Abi family protein [Salicibibacter cibi]